MLDTVTPRVVLARGVLASLRPAALANSNIVTEPAGSATVTLWSSEAGYTRNEEPFHATRFRQLLVMLKCNQNGTIHYKQSCDGGVNWDVVDDHTYTAASPNTGVVSFYPQSPTILITFENGSGSVPTTWRFTVLGDESFITDAT